MICLNERSHLLISKMVGQSHGLSDIKWLSEPFAACSPIIISGKF